MSDNIPDASIDDFIDNDFNNSPNPNNQDTTHAVAGEKRALKKAWKKLVTSETEVELMRELVKNDICLPQVNGMIKNLNLAKKSMKSKGTHDKTLEQKLMKVKLKDALQKVKEDRLELEIVIKRFKNHLPSTLPSLENPPSASPSPVESETSSSSASAN